MTIDKLVYDIREALKEFSDDSEFSNRYIEFLIALKRSKFLKQELDKFGRPFNNSILQSFCLPVEVISADQCGLDTSCATIARTTKPIPNTLQLTTREAVYRISPTDRKEKPFDMVSRNMVPYVKDAMFNKSIKAYLDSDDYIYFLSPDDIFHFECVSIEGVFEDPLELETFDKCCDCSNPEKAFKRDEEDYPVNPDLLDAIRRDIIRDLARTDATPEDTENNQQDDK